MSNSRSSSVIRHRRRRCFRFRRLCLFFTSTLAFLFSRSSFSGRSFSFIGSPRAFESQKSSSRRLHSAIFLGCLVHRFFQSRFFLGEGISQTAYSDGCYRDALILQGPVYQSPCSSPSKGRPKNSGRGRRLPFVRQRRLGSRRRFFRCLALDPFASPSNARCERFYSRYAYPGSLANDAFSVSWSHECLFVCSPIGKLIASWKKISDSPSTRGVIIFPVWKSATFWPVFFPDGIHSTWPAFSVQRFDPFINVGQFYAGVMNGKNDYLFIAIFFDTTFHGPSSSLCHLPICSCF